MRNKIILNLKETKHLLRSNWILYLLIITILFAYLVIIGITVHLQIDIHKKESQVTTIYKDINYYALRDTLYDPDSFYNYRNDSYYMGKVGNFYNSMVSASNFSYLSVFNQALPIQNFKGGNEFLYNSQAFIEENSELPANIKSIQINQTAYEFYDIKLSEGEHFKWNEILYESDVIPVFLGSEYKKLYALEDYIVGNLYNKTFTFVVKGFLKSNTFIYYNGNPEFYLDQYLLVPYPTRCLEVNPSDFQFESILYFAMINGDLISNASKESLIYEIKQISDVSDFASFSIIGLPEISAKYSEMLSVIKYNQELLYMIISVLLLLILFVMNVMGRFIIVKRIEVYKVYWLVGYTGSSKIFLRDMIVPYIGSFVVSNAMLLYLFKEISIATISITLIVTLIVFTMTYFSCRKTLSQKIHIVK